MSLLQSLQSDILNSSIGLSAILRKAKVLAYQLENQALQKWVDNELNGYEPDDGSFPDYRYVSFQIRGTFMNGGWIHKNDYVPVTALPEKWQESILKSPITEGIRSIESNLETLKTNDEKLLTKDWSSLRAYLSMNYVKNGYHCVSAELIAGGSQFEQILDAVKNRLLDFILELAKRYPEMSKDDDSVKNTSQNKDQITKLVNNYIYGGQNVIASGDEIHQQVQQQSSLESEGIKEMIDLLKAKLPEIGLSVRDEAQVQAEIQTAEAQMNSPKPRHNVIKEGLQTINRVLEGAAGNAMGGVVAGLLVAKLAPFIH